MLVTTHVPECDSADASLGNALEIERAASPAEDLDVIAAGTDQGNRTFNHEDLVLIHTGSNEDLVTLSGIP